MRHRIEHAVDAAEARRLVDETFATYAQRYRRYRPRLTWFDRKHAAFGFQARGFSVRGMLALVPGAVEIEADVPWALRPFRGTALRLIDAEAQRIFACARPGRPAASA